MWRLLLIGSAIALASCEGGNSYTDGSPAPPPPVAQMEMMADDSYTKAAPAPDRVAPQSNNENPSNQSFLAYRYGYGFSLPASSVAPTMKSHMQICLDAGTSKCQVLNSSTNQNSETNIYANLSLRAEPDWLTSYQTQILASVKDAKGQVTASNVSAQDLTRQILDTDARLKAQTTLRDRLQGLLETRNAELSDLLAVERELARVQAEIESATSTLNVLRKRVSMSVVDINYSSQAVAVSRSAVSPIIASVKGFVGQFARGLSDVIDFFAAILPWLLLVILPALWLLRRFWRARSKAKKT